MKSRTCNHLFDNLIYSGEKILNIVLDLDNTIIYTKIFDSSDYLDIKYTEIFESDGLIGKFTIEYKTYLLYIRPYFNYFLNTITMYFNIYIYTNSKKIYCDNVIKILKNKYMNFDIKKIISVDESKSLIKRLNFICENTDDLHFLSDTFEYIDFAKKTIIIDDSIEVWHFDKKNVFMVTKYTKYLNFFEESIDEIKPDDTLLIISNRLFTIHNFFCTNNKQNTDTDITELIEKFKL